MLAFKLDGLGDAAANCASPLLVNQLQCMASGGTSASADSTIYSNCASQADSDPRYTVVQNQHSIVSAWTPTSDYYNPSDVQSVVAQQAALAQQAISMLQQANSACGSAQQGCSIVAAQAINQLTVDPNNVSNVMTQAQQISAAISSAQSSAAAIAGAAYVEVDGFKSWIQRSINAIGDGIHAAIVIQCQIPGWVAALDPLSNALQAFANFVSQVEAVAADAVSAAVATGAALVKTVSVGLGITGWLFNHIVLVAGAALLLTGGFFAYKHRDRIRGYFGKRTAQVAGVRRALRGSSGFGPYLVKNGAEYRFEDAKRAKAHAKTLSREYGEHVCVTKNNARVACFAGGENLGGLSGDFSSWE